jgi:hypothetical protein
MSDMLQLVGVGVDEFLESYDKLKHIGHQIGNRQ